MQSVSSAWKTAMQEEFVPLSFVEVSYRVTDPSADTDATATDNGAESFAETSEIVDLTDKSFSKYVTCEENIWVLNGSWNLLNQASPGFDRGFVSSVLSGADGSFTTHPIITISYTQVHTNSIPGITAQWSTAFEEYATDYVITAYNGSAVVATKTVTGNTAITAFTEQTISSYNKITIEITKWCLPYRRCRLEQLVLGAKKIFANDALMGFEHSQFANMLSLELPKASVIFEINNVSGSWNPDNPQGMYQYLIERQEIVVRYGYKINNAIEWIKCGTFWLSEWETPQNGITASFTARDVLEFAQNPYTPTAGTYTLKALAESAISQSNFPTKQDGTARYSIDSSLANISVTITADFNYTCAEVLQLCANAACCVMYADRDGVLQIKPLATTLADYTIGKFVSYSNSEYSISKALKSVSVNDGQGTYTAGTSGEVQTIENELIQSSTVANAVAQWVGDCLKGRKTLSGDFRADPRLDALDKVSTQNKYANGTAFITKIDYSYNGCFKGNYEGRVVV